jgi:hypothetical protein
MAPSLQERFRLGRKKNFDAFDDSSYVSEESGDKEVATPTASVQPYVSSLEPTQEEPQEDKEQAPLPPSPPLSNEVAPSVLGRLLGKHAPGSPRKSSKNSFQSAASKLSKQTVQSTATARIDNTSRLSSNTTAPVAEDAPQTPAKPKRKSVKRPKARSQFKQSLLKGADSESDESLSDDDGHPTAEILDLLNSSMVDMDEGDHEDDKLRESLNVDREDRQDEKEDDHSERPKLLAAPSRESLMDPVPSTQNDPNPSQEEKDSMVRTSARPKRWGGRGTKEPQGAQFMPSLMSDPDADCESELSSDVNNGGYLPTPMASSRPTLLSAPSRSGDLFDDEDSTEGDNSREPSQAVPSQAASGYFYGGDEKKDDHKERPKMLPPPSEASLGCRFSDSVIESQSVPSPSEAIGPVNGKRPVVRKTRRRGGRRPKEPHPASDPECEGEGSSDEDDDGYLPTAMASSQSSRPPILSAPSQSSLEGDIFDHNEDDQSSEPNPLAAPSQASFNCSLSDLRPDVINNGEESAVFSLSALEDDKRHSSPAKSLLQMEGDESMSKLDNSLMELSMAFEDQDGGSQVNLYLAKVRQNRVKGPGEVDPVGGSVRSTRSSLSFSVTVDPNGETQSINVDTRLPTIESPTKKTRGRNIRGETKIADMSDIDAPSFAAKSTESSSRHSQRSRIASPRKQPRESPQINLSEQESRSPPLQVSPDRQDLQSPKTSRHSKSQSLHRRSKTSQPDEDLSKSGPGGEQMSMSQHSPRSPRRKMRPKGETRAPPSLPLGGDDVSQANQGPETKVSARVGSSEQEVGGEAPTTRAPTSRRQFPHAAMKETDTVEEDVSPTSVEGFSPPRRQQRKVPPVTTPRAASSRNLFKATTPTPRSTSRHISTPTTPRRAQTPRGTSSRNVVKRSDSFKRLLRQMGKTNSIRDLCSLKEDQEATPSNLVFESPQKVRESLQKAKSTKVKEDQEATPSNLVLESPQKVRESLQKARSTRYLNRSSENPGRASSSRNLMAESPRKTSSRNLVADSPRKTSSLKHVDQESPRKSSSKSVNPESPRKSSSRSVNPESPRRTSSSRNVHIASLQKSGSSRNVHIASPLKSGRDLLKRAQSSRIMPSSDWNYEPNRKHQVTPVSEDDPDTPHRDANKTGVRHLQQIPTIDIC